MSKLYFIAPDGKTVVGVDCEKNIEVTRDNTVTERSVMSGKDISDGYQAGLRSVNVSGILTYGKSPDATETLNPIEFQRILDKVVDDKEILNLYTDKTTELLDDIDNCVLQATTVTLNTFLNAVEINLTFKEVWISDSATLSTLKLPPKKSAGAAKDGSDPKKGKGGKSEVTEEQKRTLLYDDVQTIKTAVSGVFG